MPRVLKVKDNFNSGYPVQSIVIDHGKHYISIEQQDAADDLIHCVVVPLHHVHELIAKLVKEVQRA